MTDLHLGECVPPIVACLAYLIGYRQRAGTLRRAGRPVARWRQVAFWSGVLLVGIVQLPPLDSMADDVLAAHMIQHIVIGDFASLLIVLGLTGPVMRPWLQSPVSRIIRGLSHPLAALMLWAADLYAWHLPVFYQLAIRHDLVHALEHACLLWFGGLLWIALIGPLPKPAWFTGWARLGYVIVVRFAGAVLANALIWAQTTFYPVYRATDGHRGLNPLSDQNVAGGIMMVEQVLLTTAVLAWLFVRFARQDEERQQLVDLASARGVQLSDERAARAAFAGAASHLRARVLGAEDLHSSDEIGAHDRDAS